MNLRLDEEEHPNGFDLWVDQIAIADRRMGCDF
jgi:hypothetical protein